MPDKDDKDSAVKIEDNPAIASDFEVHQSVDKPQVVEGVSTETVPHTKVFNLSDEEIERQRAAKAAQGESGE